MPNQSSSPNTKSIDQNHTKTSIALKNTKKSKANKDLSLEKIFIEDNNS